MTDIDRGFDLGGYASQIQGPDDRIIIGRLTEDGQMSDSPFAVKSEGIDFPVWFRAVHLGSDDEEVRPSGWRVAWRNAELEHEFVVDDQSLDVMDPGTVLYRYRAPGGMLWVAYDPVD